MEKLKSSLTNMLVVLTVIAIIAAGVLAAVNAVTAPQIEKINAENLAAGIKAVMGADDINVAEPQEIEGGYTAYAVSDASGAALGTAVTSVSNGFGGPLKVLVGFDNEGTILGYTILEHAETPGLGAKAGDWFQSEENNGKGGKACIVGLNPGTSNFTVSKDGGDVDAITASTITSRAFLLAIKNAYDAAIAGQDATTAATAQAGKCCKKAEGKCCGKCKKGEGKCGMAEGECSECPKADAKCGKCPKTDGCHASDLGTPEVIE